MDPAQLIAANLAALPHPDGTTRVLAGFSTAMLPDGLHDQMNRTAQDIGEAVVHLLETNGYEVVAQGSRPDPADSDQPAVAHLHCALCDARLLSINVSNPAHAVTNGPVLISAVAGLRAECPHQ